ncbi:MAG TPA: 50S ribosomal protein L3 [Firmicutes bacterium]|jgi:large subunit ribosomal protein L3|nr:50S ribosomal protein L3 [Bacillota bacterium]
MPKGTLGRKLGMTQIFTENGNVVPVTVIEAGPVRVVQKKTVETDGYEAVQLGLGEKLKNVNKPERGHFAKAQVVPARKLAEFRIEDSDFMQALNVGDELKVDAVFATGEYVDVTAVSKGKGFAGPIKRHGFGRGPQTHGSMYHRRVGSLGATDPARVFKGRRMAGRMGGERCTIQGLRVVKVDGERNLLIVQGSVPGPKGCFVTVKATVKHKA